MAYTDPTERGTGYTVSAADWNVFVNNDKDLNGRVNTATSNIVTLQNLTGATGTTAAGNAALSSRLGTGVTTSNTATSQLSSLSSRASTLETNQGTRGTNGPIYTEINDLKSSSGSGPLVFFRGTISDASKTITAGQTGLNIPFSSSGFSYSEQGGFTVSGAEVHFPSNGVYMIQAQVVADSTSGSTALGLYVMKNGTAGNTDSVAAKEIQFSGVAGFVVDQLTTVIPISNAPSDYIVYRLYSNNSRTVRGTGAQFPYGATHLTITRLGSLS